MVFITYIGSTCIAYFIIYIIFINMYTVCSRQRYAEKVPDSKTAASSGD